AEEELDALGEQRVVHRVIGAFVEVDQLVQVFLFIERQHLGMRRPAPLVPFQGTASWKGALDVLVMVQGQTNLFEVVRTGGAFRRLAYLLHGRQQQSDQHTDDGDDDQ